ncbi:hypothetical protein BEWA_009210 [Theileria equi strain WA]|uniref:Uncharacterized protein n=1 Tax=Theileria equi strain WA TaxID=1537102 RepID=L0B327_THEEQ|nr:hypothetical protein BEWA_009210 [Theileria equi strain WA]AFZ81509.1 hypothetical protein BEWA_009210 [Theileria equi strain WA]|eukprot:XP_004831175.1 hypothetical protein BEWA_009210 [Theileria equi strain WA]
MNATMGSTHISPPKEGTNIPRRRAGSSPATPKELEVDEPEDITPDIPTSSGSATMDRFKNIKDESEVQSTHLEVQRPPDLFDSYEKSLIHFTSELSGQPTKAVLQLKKLADGKEIGVKCPSNSIKLLLAESEDTPVNGPLSVRVEGEHIEADITSLFDSNLANGVNLSDFWIIMDTEPDCYFAFDVAEKPVIKFDLPGFIASSLGKKSYAGLVFPTIGNAHSGLIISGAGVVVLLLVYAMFKMRKDNTDYTYFYDPAPNDMVTAT